jgi:hypothetical protein
MSIKGKALLHTLADLDDSDLSQLSDSSLEALRILLDSTLVRALKVIEYRKVQRTSEFLTGSVGHARASMGLSIKESDSRHSARATDSPSNDSSAPVNFGACGTARSGSVLGK